MSMMDVMNGGGQPPQQQQPPQPETMRMADGDGAGMQDLFFKIMSLISSEIWQKDGADRVAEQLAQEGSQPAEVIGKFVGMYLQMATSAARVKGGMLPPVVIAGAAGQTAAQLTDIALMMGIVKPDNADDTADAAALIGLQQLLQNGKLADNEKQEYTDVLTALVKASPTAQQMAAESQPEQQEAAQQDVQQMQGEHQMPDGSMMSNAMMPQGGQ